MLLYVIVGVLNPIFYPCFRRFNGMINKSCTIPALVMLTFNWPGNNSPLVRANL